MIFDKNTAKKTAELLLQIKAIKLQPQEPFTWASGWQSPIYCDNRITLSFPSIRNFIRQNIATAIEARFGKPDVIAGVATGAIAIGVLVAEELGLPFIYVRPEAKSHGRKNQIEGFIEKGQNVVVIEDLISTGASSLNAVAALKDAGVNIKGMVAIFTYNFEEANKNFNAAKVDLTCLCDYQTLIAQAVDTNYIIEKDLETLNQWRLNPSTWK
ncbi:MAG: orotate phosphoribosyltransferase [Flavobacteriales bacterium CG03_land_8_20_14_0_80_35_15]|nr:orotate phosphoribosyltransferase [Zetaproteobacteria bacterium]OIO12898.1 MAG: orotate phosphoribosyltransferase [Flavobacteriaceae bacterium CG1_02_35_72]PIR13328.1 MAG: orotate phosphoribosyltransferase [Flavobacteriales bacterium CG11_big_fil_rev_8_21_14_0_20_35_7]PIV17527.1 MAG: orotate phosphoribosyltransferase [Flavobacteriales bacterium CG03_land_8_20_14_0_80_35_15]PIX06185.1 MAG: orotate phosphoribosyltransferase [Flavobacteriales bacterium CG_4_8_14_3_um_filter_35_10]PJA04866.1 MA